MTKIIVRLHKSASARRVDDAMNLWTVLDATDFGTGALNIVYFSLHGIHSRRVNRRSTKVYMVTRGKLIARVDGEIHEFGERDVCVVPPDVWCELEGISAEVAMIITPPFDRNDETKT